MKNVKTLIFGVVFSLVLLFIFGWLQSTDSKILTLPSQWIAIAVLPLLIALFIGGFIKSFKGFGIELEAALKTPITSLNLTASDAVADIKGDEKRSMMYLDGLSSDQKNEVKWLLFRTDKKGYYRSYAVIQYLRELTKIQYFEIRGKSDKIVGFIPISVFKDSTDYNDFNEDMIQQFITAIDAGNVAKVFKDSMITLKVSSKQGLVEVLKAMRSENAEFAAVMSPTGKYIGVVLATEVEKKIADSVISVQAT